MRYVKASPAYLGKQDDYIDFDIVWTRIWTLVGARIARFWIARLGSVHLPVRCVTYMREKESPLIILQLEGRERISYPGLGVWNT
ncbi:hypothetical protein CRG98_030825 [Punica granatum]|uniref:Uncharacterized protein n=1 Tax=Punica granatum TaxID=22663 RepID=A0A2I0IYH3_PUNGR|nr:hypothetical protein CRG98_030825 [Punica granatum]